jgi:hypothetical protein
MRTYALGALRAFYSKLAACSPGNKLAHGGMWVERLASLIRLILNPPADNVQPLRAFDTTA